MPLYRGITNLLEDSAPVLDPAPTLDDFLLGRSDTAGTSHSYSTSALDITDNDVYVALSNNGSSASLATFAGADDTSVATAGVDSNPRLLLRKMTIVSSLDGTWTGTYNASTRLVALGLAIAGMGTLLTVATKTGSGGTLPSCDDFPVSGGPLNLLVIDIANVMGAHVTSPPSVPDGHTLIAVGSSTFSNDPTSTSRTTLIGASRTYASTDLAWPSGVGTVPAATFGGLDNIGTQAWRTLRLVFIP